jgi:UPF0755 protein
MKHAKSMKKGIGMRWLAVVCILLAGLLMLWIFRPATSFDEDSRVFLLPSDSTSPADVADRLISDGILAQAGLLESVATDANGSRRLKPGRYRISKGMSQLRVLEMLIKGKQEPVRFVINKFRTKEDFARYAGRVLECDSAEVAHFLMSVDSMARFGQDTLTAMSLVIPNTYEIYWNTDAGGLIRRMSAEHDRFWNAERKTKATRLGLRPEEVYTMASIIEEESNKKTDKTLIASVYINRIKKGMTLSADPTLKYALRDFGLKRIRFKHIDAVGNSPFNTYRVKGLPPGPICTPSPETIDAVLDAPETTFIFFCARPDFSGYHDFASDERQHMANARAYQRALDSLYGK